MTSHFAAEKIMLRMILQGLRTGAAITPSAYVNATLVEWYRGDATIGEVASVARQHLGEDVADNLAGALSLY